MSKNGTLFGDPSFGITLGVSDSGGLGDTEGRDEEFADDVSAHVRSKGGVHGIVYVHNACNMRLDRQTKSSLLTLVATLANENTRRALDAELQ